MTDRAREREVNQLDKHNIQTVSHLLVPEAEGAAVLLVELAHEARLALRNRRRRRDVHGMMVVVTVGRRFPASRGMTGISEGGGRAELTL